MRYLAWFCLCAVGFGVAQELLTTDAVVKMVKAGIEESLIVDMVRTHPGKFDLTSTQLTTLRAAGIPAKVLSAMIAKDAENRDSGPGLAPPLNVWSAPAMSNKLNQRPPVESSEWLPAGAAARVQVTASCGISADLQAMDSAPDLLRQSMQQMMTALDPNTKVPAPTERSHADTRNLEFRFQYNPPKSSGLSLQTTRQQQTGSIDAFGNNVTVSAPRSCVVMTVVLDGSGRSGVVSGSCGTANLATINFPATKPGSLATRMVMGQSNREIPQRERTIGTMVAGAASASDPTVAVMKEALGAGEIRVELPISNGSSVVAEIRPGEPGFRQFASACLREFPDPPEPQPVAPLHGGAKFGMTVAPLTPALAQAMALSPNRRGLIIRSLSEAGPAGRCGLRRGDLVYSIDLQPVYEEADIDAALMKRKQEGLATIAYFRGGRGPLESCTLSPLR